MEAIFRRHRVLFGSTGVVGGGRSGMAVEPKILPAREPGHTYHAHAKPEYFKTIYK